MVSLSFRISFSILFLITRAAHLYAKCCPGDVTCSGCWMCEGCELRKCTDTYTAAVERCGKVSDLWEQLECYCDAYGHYAKCWYAGVCCTEFAPSLAGAANICNLRTWPKDQVTQSLLDKVVGEAETVRNTIWHNDSGYNIPKLSVHIEAHDGITASTQSSSYSSRSQVSGQSSSSYSSKHTRTQEHSYSIKTTGSIKHENKLEAHPTQPQSALEPPDKVFKPNPENHTKQQPQPEPKPKSETHKHQQNSPEYKPQPNPTHRDTGKRTNTDNHGKIHHRAKPAVEHHGCQQTSSQQQYHHARHHHPQSKLMKRDETLFANPPKSYPSIDNVQLWKRTNSFETDKGKTCGVSFQGIPYPSEIPESLRHIFGV